MARACWAITILLATSLGVAAFPRPAHRPVTREDVLYLLNNYVPSRSVAQLVKEKGIDFAPEDDYLKKVRAAGGKDDLLEALREAHRVGPRPAGSERPAADAQVQEHWSRALELEKLESYSEAEQEYRAALAIDSQNSALHVGLGRALSKQESGMTLWRNIARRYAWIRARRKRTPPWDWRSACEVTPPRPSPNCARRCA